MNILWNFCIVWSFLSDFKTISRSRQQDFSFYQFLQELLLIVKKISLIFEKILLNDDYFILILICCNFVKHLKEILRKKSEEIIGKIFKNLIKLWRKFQGKFMRKFYEILGSFRREILYSFSENKLRGSRFRINKAHFFVPRRNRRRRDWCEFRSKMTKTMFRWSSYGGNRKKRGEEGRGGRENPVGGWENPGKIGYRGIILFKVSGAGKY